MTAPGRLSAPRLAAYAAPQVFLAALFFPVFVYLAPFYNEERGVSLEAIGLILIGARLLDAVTDPAMGYLSDRWTTRLGRRKIWLAVATPLVCLAVWRAMVPPEDAGALYFAVWITALTLAWTVALTPYFAWGAELAVDYAGRARAAAWRESAFLIGTFAAAALYAQGGGGGGGLERIAFAVVVGMPFAALLALAFAPEPADRSAAPPLTLSEGAAALRANAPFRRLLASHIANSMANATPAALFLFFAGGVLGADDAAAGGILAVYFLTAVLAAPLWSWASRRAPKHVIWRWAMLYACTAFAITPFLGQGLFGGYDMVIFAVISALTGVAFGADLILPSAMQADVVDVDTAATGRQRTGLYFAIWSVAMKGASAIAGGAALFLLGAAGHQAGAVNDAQALGVLAALYAGVPIALKLWAVWLLRGYDLGAEAQERLRRRIAQRAAGT